MGGLSNLIPSSQLVVLMAGGSQVMELCRFFTMLEDNDFGLFEVY
jgi:hypothetical protein